MGKCRSSPKASRRCAPLGGNLAIVTQTIPALDEIYGENTRRSLQGGAGVKPPLTSPASEQKTIRGAEPGCGQDHQAALITRSIARSGVTLFEGRSVSERTEDTPLLTEDQARRMDLDEVILVIDAQMPIRARRIKYFEDPLLRVLHAGQAGSFPYPDEDGLRRDRQMTETRETVEKLKQELREVRAAAGAQGSEAAALPKSAHSPSQEPTRFKACAVGPGAREGRTGRCG